MEKKKMVYVVRQNAEWDYDFVEVYTTRKKLAQALCEHLKDDGAYLEVKDIEKHIKEREARGCVYLFFVEELDETLDGIHYQYDVSIALLD